MARFLLVLIAAGAFASEALALEIMPFDPPPSVDLKKILKLPPGWPHAVRTGIGEIAEIDRDGITVYKFVPEPRSRRISSRPRKGSKCA